MCKQAFSTYLFGLCVFLGTPLAAQDRDLNFADPLRPFSHAQTLTPEQEAQARLHLQAILTGNRGAYAVINNQPVSAGDEVDGYTILQISDGTVLLGKDNGQRLVMQPHTLTFNPASDIEPSRSEP
ncbi:hypothetical protein [Nitrincola iocasae]|uniref:MSHA biogenesis protein MshK n=1 Tax=Nitrincola iocasae TaxID=2614693 RepID=A0A5J6LII4_9GAMM|nr:hypothetical protein [Nitrincola iocasae]QEW08116.1 hypothetical protein F5I99_17350 [Nitrincola iocasae]